jgi:hypothetical protein
VLLLQCQRLSSTPIQNHRQNDNLFYLNFYGFRQKTRRQLVSIKVINRIARNISALNFLINQISIRYCSSKIFKHCHIFEISISCLMLRFCLSFWWGMCFLLSVFTSRLIFLVASINASAFLFEEFSSAWFPGPS